VADIVELAERLLSLDVAATMAAYPILQPLRAEVICAGALIAAELARRVGRPMVVRETDILDGAALDLVRSAASP
jgi:exopolyphosphatase/guanosine-5'-triphosphate,3'-diphosphate pyrophosphatase